MTTEGIDQGAGAVSANINDVVPKSVFDVSLLPLKPAIAAWKNAVGTGNDVRLSALPEKSLPTRMEGWHTFTVTGAPLAEDTLALNAGLDVNVSKNATLGVSYNGQLGSGVSDHGARASLSVRF